MEKDKEKYRAEIVCWNCRHIKDFVIPKAIPIKDFIKTNKIICENCGCDSRQTKFTGR